MYEPGPGLGRNAFSKLVSSLREFPIVTRGTFLTPNLSGLGSYAPGPTLLAVFLFDSLKMSSIFPEGDFIMNWATPRGSFVAGSLYELGLGLRELYLSAFVLNLVCLGKERLGKIL